MNVTEHKFHPELKADWEVRNFDTGVVVVLAPRDERGRRALIATCTGETQEQAIEYANAIVKGHRDSIILDRLQDSINAQCLCIEADTNIRQRILEMLVGEEKFREQHGL